MPNYKCKSHRERSASNFMFFCIEEVKRDIIMVFLCELPNKLASKIFRLIIRKSKKKCYLD